MGMKTIFLLLGAAALPLGAEVYWLGPGRKAGASDRIAALLPGMEKVLFTEKITVNGFPCAMEVSAVNAKMDELVVMLRKLKAENLSFSGNTLRFQRPAGKMKERFLLIGSRRPDRPLTCFRMLVPEKLPPPEKWPAELPSLPPGAKITAVTRFGSGGVCGEFRNAQEPPYILLRRADSELRGKKMYAAGNEVASRYGGRGEIYFDKNTIVWVNFHESGAGCFFSRRRK